MLSVEQVAFYQAILGKKTDSAFIASSDADERLAIYRQTVIQNLIHALSLTYPGVWKLLGQGCADGIAKRYCQTETHLPTTGCLDDWGEGLVYFFKTIPEVKSLPYLEDYARYEWHKHQSLCANPLKNLSLSTINNLLNNIPEARITFHPSLQLFLSQYPIDDIDALIQNPDHPGITLKCSPTYGLIIRLDQGVTTYWIDKNCYEFIACLKSGITIDLAYEKQIKADPSFDLPAALTIILQSGAIVHIE